MRARTQRHLLHCPAALAPLLAEPAAAHGTERGFVLLLPTGSYLAGGALAVAASFLAVSVIPSSSVARLSRARLKLWTLPTISPTPASLAAFLVLLLLLLAGVYGSRDPLANPLPLTVWTVWWVGITLLHAVFGNLWAWINPWTGPYRLLDRLAGGRIASAPPMRYPRRAGYWPAVGFFLVFAWLELVYPAPDDPGKLAVAVALYWILAFAGMLAFGETAWRHFAEPFSIFFRLVAGLSPLVRSAVRNGQGRTWALACPGAAFLQRDPLPIPGVLFVLLTLSSVSFDALSKTFWWLGLGEINPLEFPGRTAVIGRNTLGLLLAFATLTLIYVAAIALGWRLAGRAGTLAGALGSFVFSIVPISMAFHLSHYLPAFLVDGQYALIAASDPFATGANLFGSGDLHVTTSFLNTYAGVRFIWNLQTTAIVLGHIVAVALAHAIAVGLYGTRGGTVASQAPLALVTVLYTLFGLWLLSTPVVG